MGMPPPFLPLDGPSIAVAQTNMRTASREKEKDAEKEEGKVT